MRPPFPTQLLPVAAALFTLSAALRAADAIPTPPPASASVAQLSAAVSPTGPAPASSAGTAPAPERTRPLSAATAARLAEKMPKFAPPATAPAPTSPLLADANSTPPAPDLRELDRPRNTIIRLPNYVVQEEKPPAFKARHLLTVKGRLDLAFKRHPGLNFGSLSSLLNEGVALAMLEEDFRLERQAEAQNLLSLVTDPTGRSKAATEVQETFRRSDWLPNHK